jgi:hypothetical protein
MIESRRTWLYIAFLAGVLAVGIPYWLMPYGQVNLPSALLTPALGVVVAAAFLARIGRTASFWRVVLVVGSTVPAAVFLRVVWDTTRNPTSHNLWPFEVIIALMVGLCCSLSGAVAGMIGAMIKTPQPAERRS